MRQKIFFLQRFITIILICPRSNIEIISENRSESNSNDSKHFFLYYFRNPKTRSYEYLKYKIFNPSRKRRETDTQFQVSKHNSLLDLIDTYRFLWKALLWLSFNQQNRQINLCGSLPEHPIEVGFFWILS
ncbi:hypothetical protein EJ110_NYTH50739 [Nymphaea thermarum]|nr:hypothetical protein EJ110_NYTH50739 [Nymphaea thermarum]